MKFQGGAGMCHAVHEQVLGPRSCQLQRWRGQEMQERCVCDSCTASLWISGSLDLSSGATATATATQAGHVLWWPWWPVAGYPQWRRRRATFCESGCFHFFVCRLVLRSERGEASKEDQGIKGWPGCQKKQQNKKKSRIEALGGPIDRPALARGPWPVGGRAGHGGREPTRHPSHPAACVDDTADAGRCGGCGAVRCGAVRCGCGRAMFSPYCPYGPSKGTEISIGTAYQ